MRFLILAASLALAAADGTGGDHHHHHDHDHDAAAPSSNYAAPAAPASNYGAPAAPAAPAATYGAPAAPTYNAPAADSYGAPQQAPVYAPPASEYGAPQQEYAAPQDAYGAPQDAYGAPQDAYGAPADQEYGAPAPTSYEAPANAPTAYEAAGAAVADMMSGDILATLAPLFPILIAVGAAIVISMIFSPILAGLFGLKFAAFLGFINPVGNFKLSLVNILLSPFGLTLANVGPPLNTNQPFAPFGGRDADSGFTLDQEKIDMVTDLLYNAIRSKSLSR